MSVLVALAGLGLATGGGQAGCGCRVLMRANVYVTHDAKDALLALLGWPGHLRLRGGGGGNAQKSAVARDKKNAAKAKERAGGG